MGLICRLLYCTARRVARWAGERAVLPAPDPIEVSVRADEDCDVVYRDGRAARVEAR